MILETNLSELPKVTKGEHQAILDAPRTEEAHRSLLAGIAGMNAVQTGGQASAEALSDDVTIAAWNVERCLFPEDTAAHVAQLKPDVVLLSEVDHGMARTQQQHTTEMMAQGLGMAYAFGVEFYEMDLGGATEREFCTDDFNALGWHGNAVLSSVPFEKTALIRLDDHGHWFSETSKAADPEQPRIGGRMAIAAVLPGQSGPICVVSVHLESNSLADFRHVQFDRLLNAIDEFAPDMPVIIGGDLNTGNRMLPDYDWRSETLFDLGREHGYRWDFTADGQTTRPSLITRHPSRVMKLDWITGRSVEPVETGILSSLDRNNRPLSDHDCVWAKLRRT